MNPIAKPWSRRSGGRGRCCGGAASAAWLHFRDACPASQRAGEACREEGFEVCRACERGVDRFKLAGGLQEEWGAVAAAPGGERDLPTEETQPRALEVVGSGRLGAGAVASGACLEFSTISWRQLPAAIGEPIGAA